MKRLIYSIERDKQYENFGKAVLVDIFFAIIKILDIANLWEEGLI